MQPVWFSRRFTPCFCRMRMGHCTLVYFPLDFKPQFSHSGAFLHWLQVQLNSESEEVLPLIISTCWGIWLHKNDIIFNKKSTTPQEAMASISQLISDFRLLNIVAPADPSPSSNCIWKPPQTNHIKINTDAGWCNMNKWRLGAVFRNNEGTVLIVSSKEISGDYKPEIAEASKQ